MADEEQVQEFEQEVEQEEDLVDPQDELKESCGERHECVNLREILDECTERVESRSNTTETCTQELFDFVHCVDHCVAKNLFQKLK